MSPSLRWLALSAVDFIVAFVIAFAAVAGACSSAVALV
jgi:hypothetical protein